MIRFVLTCEHASRNIPRDYGKLFSAAEDDLLSHRGFDPGALEIFTRLKNKADFALPGEYSRLLIDLNRALTSRHLFSGYTTPLPSEERAKIISRYYEPYRRSVSDYVFSRLTAGEKIFHMSIHSFTPVLDGNIRNADIGILYDPSRPIEKKSAELLKGEIRKSGLNVRVRMNYPYRGISDGFTTWFRKSKNFHYAGIEFEVNQGKISMIGRIADIVESSLPLLLADDFW